MDNDWKFESGCWSAPSNVGIDNIPFIWKITVRGDGALQISIYNEEKELKIHEIIGGDGFKYYGNPSYAVLDCEKTDKELVAVTMHGPIGLMFYYQSEIYKNELEQEYYKPNEERTKKISDLKNSFLKVWNNWKDDCMKDINFPPYINWRIIRKETT